MTDQPSDRARNAAELKPCPFCGGTNIDPAGWASLTAKGPACDDCGASAGGISNDHAANIAAWNQRATFERETPGFAAGVEAADPRLALFIEAIHRETPNGEYIAVKHHPNGDWSVSPGELHLTPAPPASDAIARLEAKNAGLRSALEQIAHTTRRKQLPITNEVNELATAALTNAAAKQTDDGR